MTIDELAQSFAKKVPNAFLAKYYWLAAPQYRIKCTLTMLKPKKITVLQEYILRFIAAGVDNIGEISNFLGVSLTSVNSAVAQMDHDNLVIVDLRTASAKLTPTGTAAIDELNLVIPTSTECDLLMDGLTGEIRIASRVGISPRNVKQLGLSAVVPQFGTPTIEDLAFEPVSKAIAKFKKTQSSQAERFEGELQEVVDVSSVTVEYEKVAVLVYINNDQDLAELQIYGGTSLAIHKTEYETVLTKMYKEGVQIFKLDKRTEVDDASESNDGETPSSFKKLIPEELFIQAKDNTAATEDQQKKEELSAYRAELEDVDDRTTHYSGSHSDTSEEEALTQRRAELKREIDRLEEELAQQKAVRILSTYEHRPLLIDALQSSQTSVVIISPWIKAQSMDTDVLELIRAAVNRGVKITIGYGISNKTDSDSDVINQLENIKRKSKGNLVLIAANNTHEKVLIKDDEYIVITSFNWMSFRGNVDWGFRRETGIYLESKDIIKSMKSDIEERFSIKLA